MELISKVDLPLKMILGRKNYALNLNFYRNAHYQILNKMKVDFTKAIEPELVKLPELTKANLSYSYYPGSLRLSDVANVCSIVDKFFCDALVKAGKLPDDNYQYLPKVSYAIGGVDKENPRVTVSIFGEIKNADHPD